MANLVTTYKGEKIERDGEGFFWRDGGYFDTLIACQEDIDWDQHQDDCLYPRDHDESDRMAADSERLEMFRREF